MSTSQADAVDRRLIRAIQGGLPLVSEPYRAVGQQIGLAAQEVAARIAGLRERGVIKRFGVVVRHHELGYRANAMVVWDVPDDEVRAMGETMAALPFVTLCYRRRRHAAWPYNLYCMIHGTSRGEVLDYVEEVKSACVAHNVPHEVLFSRRRFKQRGARYVRG